MATGRRPTGPGRATPRAPRPAGTRPVPAAARRLGVNPAPASASQPKPGGRKPGGATAPTSSNRWLRLVVMCAVLMVLVVLLAPAMRTWVDQKRQIQALEEKIARQKQTVSELKREQLAWKDPAFIKAQARERLKYVAPGERAFTTLDQRPGSTSTPSPGSDSPAAQPKPPEQSQAWFGMIWESTQNAAR